MAGAEYRLGLRGWRNPTRKHYYRLKEAFQESDLPIRVDLVDWHRISPEFRTVIEGAFEVLRQGKNAQDAEIKLKRPSLESGEPS